MLSNPSAINAAIRKGIAKLITDIDDEMQTKGTGDIIDDSECYRIACLAFLSMQAIKTMPKEDRERYIEHLAKATFTM